MEETRPKRLREDPPAREELREKLREKLDRYLNVPFALASLALVLLAVIELTGDVRSSRLGSLGTIPRQAQRGRDRGSALHRKEGREIPLSQSNRATCASGARAAPPRRRAPRG